MCARIIYRLPKYAHSPPLLKELDLDALSERRTDHIRKIVDASIIGECHPALVDWWKLGDNGELLKGDIYRAARKIGERRITNFAGCLLAGNSNTTII